MVKVIKKIMSVSLAVAVVASGIAAPTMKAEAAKSAKIPVTMFFAGNGINAKGKSNDCIWLEQGKKKVTKTFKAGKKVHVSLSVSAKAGQGAKQVKGATVFVVDTKGILKKFKKVKYSNVVVKCDGKKVSSKSKQGYFEPKQKTESWRLSFANKWGSNGDPRYSGKQFKFKKKLTVSFDIVAK